MVTAHTHAGSRPGRSRLALPVLLLGLCLPGAVLAQQPAPRAADRTGTGAGPDTTITAPYTNSLGVTKPPGDALGAPESSLTRAEQRERALGTRIEGTICDGCK